MKNDPIEDYIIRFLSRQERPEDVKKLKEWLKEDDSHRDKLKEWLKVWDAADLLQNKDKYDADNAYQRFLLYLEEAETQSTPDTKVKPSRRLFFRTFGHIAALFILSFSLGASCFYFFMKEPAVQEVTYVETIIPLGSKSEVVLPDGTAVWINAGSKLRYPTNYRKGNQHIYLEGEGYFKVAKQGKNAFTVHTSQMSVHALGTEFNVKAYPEEESVETILIDGKVKAYDQADTPSWQSVTLMPGQKIFLAAPHSEPTVTELTSEEALAAVSWKDKNWRIEKEYLKTLAVKLGRRYDVTITLDDKMLDYRFSGTLKDESLEQVLTAMQHSAPILYKIEGKQVYLYADPKRMK